MEDDTKEEEYEENGLAEELFDEDGERYGALMVETVNRLTNSVALIMKASPDDRSRKGMIDSGASLTVCGEGWVKGWLPKPGDVK